LQEFEWLPRGNIQGNRANESKNKRPEQASDDDLARSLKEVAIDPQTAPTISSSTSKIPDLRHAMQLKSAVDNGCILNNRPETYSYYTNYTTDFKDILDYIYFDATTMEVLRVHPFPPEAELRRDTAIPSEVFPSDHVAVVVDLNYRGTPQDCV
jgi:mRNA deadenylase 3'-5' endonuclease subunit Ccr4